MSEDIATLFDSSSEVAEVAETSETEVIEKVEVEETKAPTEETEATDKVVEESEKAKVEPTSTEEHNEKQEWTFHAVKDERQKRQNAEAKIKELELKLEGGEQKTPDIFEDQEGFVKSINAKHQDELLKTRINIFREIMIENHDDYIEKEEKFIVLAKKNPILLVEMTNSSNPAKFAYEQIVKHEQFDDMQDIDSLKDKIRAELRLELENELKTGKTAETEKEESLSPSLAKARGSTDKAEKLSNNPGDLF